MRAIKRALDPYGILNPACFWRHDRDRLPTPWRRTGRFIGLPPVGIRPIVAQPTGEPYRQHPLQERRTLFSFREMHVRFVRSAEQGDR